jgi:hypothetical protein
MMTVQPEVDIDEYLAALPVRQLGAPRPGSPNHYQVSRWPLLKPFNGFSGLERRRGGQLAIWLLAAGCIALPSRCDICTGRGPLALHGDNYYDATRDPALCAPCHRALHLRPYQWNAWRRIVDASVITGREWFALAPRHGLDLAQHLREKFGWRVADIERSPLSPLPDAIAVALPNNMLSHPHL